MSAIERCGKRYGKRRQLRCRRPAGHSGPHALRLRVHEIPRGKT